MNHWCFRLRQATADDVLAMIGFMQIFGYKDPLSPVGWNISAEVQQLIGSLMTLGAMIASAFAGPFAAKFGRKSCIWVGCPCGQSLYQTLQKLT